MWNRTSLVLAAVVLAACGDSGEPDGNQPGVIEIAPADVEMEVDSAVRLTAAGVEGIVFWSADDESVVHLSDLGGGQAEVRGRRVGATMIRVRDEPGERTGAVPATVFADMTISPQHPDVQVTRTVQLAAVDAAGPVTWSSLDESVACVSSTGLVTGIEPGGTAITATSGVQRAIVSLGVHCDPPGEFGALESDLTFLRLPAGGPVPETVDTSMYVIVGEGRELTIYFRSPGGGRGAEYVTLEFTTLGSLNGVPLERGDSLLVRLLIPDPYEVRFELQPAELYPEGGFDTIARLVVNYADTDYPRVEPEGGYNKCLLQSFGEWTKSEELGRWVRAEFTHVGLETGVLNGRLYQSGAFGMAYDTPDF